MNDYGDDGGLFDGGLSRNSDPSTSNRAAALAPKGRALAVMKLMRDGMKRTDEHIANGLDGYTDTSARHGRKALSDAGVVVCVGEAKSESGRATRVWQYRGKP